MSEKKVRVCDNGRCGADITRGPYQRITLHKHHETTIDLCLPCARTIDRWLNPDMVYPGRDGEEIENA